MSKTIQELRDEMAAKDAALKFWSYAYVEGNIRIDLKWEELNGERVPVFTYEEVIGDAPTRIEHCGRLKFWVQGIVPPLDIVDGIKCHGDMLVEILDQDAPLRLLPAAKRVGTLPLKLRLYLNHIYTVEEIKELYVKAREMGYAIGDSPVRGGRRPYLLGLAGDFPDSAAKKKAEHTPSDDFEDGESANLEETPAKKPAKTKKGKVGGGHGMESYF